jgi:hypothetical protein
VSVNPPYKLLNAGSNVYGICYVYHDALVHLNDVLHKSLPSVSVSVCVPLIVARQLLGKNVIVAVNIHATIEELLVASSSTWSVSYKRELSGLVLPRTSFCTIPG